MNALREIKTYDGHILTLSLDQIESTFIPDPQLSRKKAYIRTKGGDKWEVAREEGVNVTMDWHAFMGSASVSVG